MSIGKRCERGRLVRDGILADRFVLRVMGNSKAGFRLAGQKANGNLYPFGQTYPTQTEAVEYGVTKFNKKAVKVTARKAVAA